MKKIMKALLVANDAGGAEFVSAWALRALANNAQTLTAKTINNHHSFSFCATGPAKRIFERDFGAITFTPLSDISSLGSIDFILTGTSLACDLERDAIEYALKNKIKCISFLDHWDLYRERFKIVYPNELMLPNEIWVGDQYAYDYAIKVGLPSSILKIIQNPYYERIQCDAKNLKLETGDLSSVRILYICEPISKKLESTYGSDAKIYDSEITTLSKLLNALVEFKQQLNCITLRLHPSETEDKYKALLESFASKLPLKLSKNLRLIDDVVTHNKIVGVESMGLVIALVLKKEVYSYVTGVKWPISLPHYEIKKIETVEEIFK